jgi:long-chain acyl-CoA synthetase
VKKPKIWTLRSLLNDSAERFQEKPALRWLDGKEYCYDEVEERALKLALRLAELGLRRGDKIAILAESRPEWGIVYFGITAAGYVAVPILPDFLPTQVAAIIKHAECEALIASAKLAAKLPAEVTQSCHFIEIADAVEGPEEDPIGDDLEADPVPVSWDAFRPPEEGDLAAIIYTSGTTGRPKGVMLSHRALAYDAWGASTFVRLKPGKERFLSILPIAHAYECTVGFLTPFTFGASVTYLDRPPSPSILLPALKQVRPTMMLSVPLVIEKIVRNSVFPKIAAMHMPKAKLPRAILRSLAVKIAGSKLRKTFGGKLWFFGIGGAAVAPDVEQFLRQAKFPYAIGYGMTEAAPLIAGDSPWKQAYRSTGIPVRGVQIRIAAAVNAQGEGEIQVKGPNVMEGYFKEPDLTRDAFTPDGWLRTGDLGTIDERGLVYIRGRLKTMILGPSGENIYPEEIEALINSFDFVEESLVYGDHEDGLTALVQLKPDVVEKLLSGVSDGVTRLEDGVEKLGIEVKVLEEKAGHLLDALKKGVNTRLQSFSRLKRFVIHTEPFEKTPSKKIKRDKYPLA